jgi:hypothetical protein
MMAMSYGNVFVGQISIGANPLHALRTIRAAESYRGTSLLIALSHCIGWGIDMTKGMQVQKEAVACGYWPLYHFDPRDEHPFHLDSKAPKGSFKEFALKQARFAMLARSKPEDSERFLGRWLVALAGEVEPYGPVQPVGVEGAGGEQVDQQRVVVLGQQAAVERFLEMDDPRVVEVVEGPRLHARPVVDGHSRSLLERRRVAAKRPGRNLYSLYGRRDGRATAVLVPPRSAFTAPANRQAADRGYAGNEPCCG